MKSCERVNKPCEDCGVMMENVSPLRCFCPVCAKKRRDAGNAKYREKHRAEKTGIEQAKPIFNPNAKYCKGCWYWAGGTGEKCCNYIFYEDRKRPCPPGKDCTVRIQRRKWNG